MIKDNKVRKTYVKEALGNRNYLSYRTDLMLSKILVSFVVFIATYFIYLDLILSLLLASLVFFVFTLVNKINVDKKNEKGKNMLMKKVKEEYFSSKIEEINQNDFEMLIKLFFNNEGYNNIFKKGRSLYLAEKEGYITCIKIFKLYDGIEVEKLDIRSLLTFMGNSNIRNGFLVTTSSLSEDAAKLIEKFKDRFEITVIDIEGMYSLADKYNMLPDESFYYKRLNEEKVVTKNDFKENVLNIRKIYLYIAASLFFYMSSVWMPENKLVIYISYFFIVLTIINILYFSVIKYNMKKQNTEVKNK
ncbi:MAG: restriction endonuclease [Tissierellia bacterium]|nr:restriction endonuclease [Tissierellia bacterium]